MSRVAVEGLTARQSQILSLIAEGLNTREVANKLNLVQSTVKTHLTYAYTKLNARTRTHAVVLAHRKGWIDISK